MYNKQEVAYVNAKRNNKNKNKTDTVKLKNKHKPKLYGKTIDDKKVIGNLFFIVESRGVLLEEAINLFYDNNYVIDWLSFYNDGISKNWNSSTIIKKIEYSFDESDYKHLKKDIKKRLIYCINKEKEL